MKGFNTPLLITLRRAALAITTSHARAQPAPDGNAHPESNLVMDTNDAGWAFGAPTESATSTAKEKHAFAEVLDLEPLADLAVFHNGRVKILDSLARETVERMCGRRNYFEFLPPENEGDDPTKIAFPPLFTLLDCAIDPFHYADKPLIHVEYLPLRRLLLEAEFPDDERMRERYMRLTRLTPAIIERHAPAVIEAHGFEAVVSGIRRDEQAIRAKERVFSPRGEDGAWDFRDQPPEFWDQYNAKAPRSDNGGGHVRVHPLLHWTERDIWLYIQRENIPVVPLYFARDGKRFRSLGEEGITFPIDSQAATIDEIIAELDVTTAPERQGRAMDHESEDAFERLRESGYM